MHTDKVMHLLSNLDAIWRWQFQWNERHIIHSTSSSYKLMISKWNVLDGFPLTFAALCICLQTIIVIHIDTMSDIYSIKYECTLFLSHEKWKIVLFKSLQFSRKKKKHYVANVITQFNFGLNAIKAGVERIQTITSKKSILYQNSLVFSVISSLSLSNTISIECIR